MAVSNKKRYIILSLYVFSLSVGLCLGLILSNLNAGDTVYYVIIVLAVAMVMAIDAIYDYATKKQTKKRRKRASSTSRRLP